MVSLLLISEGVGQKWGHKGQLTTLILYKWGGEV